MSNETTINFFYKNKALARHFGDRTHLNARCSIHAIISAKRNTDNVDIFRLSEYIGHIRKNVAKTRWIGCLYLQGKKWNESGFRPPLCTYRLNWARRTSWGWWDDWDDTVLQTQDSKFEPWRSEAEHASSRSRRLPTILTFTRGWGRNIFVSFKPPRPGTEPRTLAWKAAVLTTTLGPPPTYIHTYLQGKHVVKIIRR